MQKFSTLNKDFWCLLMIFDVFSKYWWALRNKHVMLWVLLFKNILKKEENHKKS